MEHADWDIRREGRRWTRDEAERRMYQAPEKIEFAGGIFTSTDARLTVLAMLLENLGIDQAVRLGKLADWKAAIADLEKRRGECMKDTYTAIMKQSGPWWIGWIAEVPGVNCQERTKQALLETLQITLQEALELNRREAREAAGEGFEEAPIVV